MRSFIFKSGLLIAVLAATPALADTSRQQPHLPLLFDLGSASIQPQDVTWR